MALQEIEFVIHPMEKKYETIPVDWSHNGVVGSGDMELLLRRAENDGSVKVKIVTPMRGFDEVWERVLKKFVTDSNLGNVNIEINDNNSSPFVVATRLRQGLLEAKAGERE